MLKEQKGPILKAKNLQFFENIMVRLINKLNKKY